MGARGSPASADPRRVREKKTRPVSIKRALHQVGLPWNSLCLVLLFALALCGATPAWGIGYGTTPSGQGGFVRALDARTTPAGVAVHKFHFGFFQQDSFLRDYEDHWDADGGYSFTISPSWPPLVSRAEWAVGLGARYYTIHTEEPNRRTQNLINYSVSDLTLGAKVSFHQGDIWALAAAFRGRMPASSGTNQIKGDAFSPDLVLLNSLSLGALRLHLNTGYRVDNTIKVFGRGKGEPAPSRSTRFSQGVVTEDSYILGAVVEAPEVRRITGFLEGFVFYDADGQALDSKGRTVDLGFSDNPIWLTPGVKARLTDRVIGELAADVGMFSGDFPGEDEILPSWRAIVGISWLGFPREPAPAAAVPPVMAAPPPAPAIVVPSDTPPPVGGEIQPSSPTVEPAAAVPQVEATVPEPEPAPLIEVTAEKIVISQTIRQFASGKAEFLPLALPALDEVVEVLRQHPEIKVKVDGHTDSSGNPATNLRLSQARAEAVMRYLVEKGIDASRMEARGYGDTVPIVDNITLQGRGVNRRVEFVVVEEGQ